MLLQKINEFKKEIESNSSLFFISKSEISVPYIFQKRIDKILVKIFKKISYSDIKTISKTIDTEFDLERLSSTRIKRYSGDVSLFSISSPAKHRMVSSVCDVCINISEWIFDKSERAFDKVCIFFIQKFLENLSHNKEALASFVENCNPDFFKYSSFSNECILECSKIIGLKNLLKKFTYVSSLDSCHCLFSYIYLVSYTKEEISEGLKYLNNIISSNHERFSPEAHELYLSTICFLDSMDHDFEDEIFNISIFESPDPRFEAGEECKHYIDSLIRKKIEKMDEMEKFEFILKISDMNIEDIGRCKSELIFNSVMDTIDDRRRAIFIVPLRNIANSLGKDIFSKSEILFS